MKETNWEERLYNILKSNGPYDCWAAYDATVKEFKDIIHQERKQLLEEINEEIKNTFVSDSDSEAGQGFLSGIRYALSIIDKHLQDSSGNA